MFVLIGGVACAPRAIVGQNLLRNGGFEEGYGSYPGVGKYWETNDGQPHPEVDALDHSIKHAGNWSQHLKANFVWDLGMVRQVSGYGSVTPGREYLVQAWIKTANVANPAGWYVFGIWWFNAADQVIGEVKMPQQETLNYDWRLVVFKAVAPAGASRVAALLTRHTDGDAWYDDVLITDAVTAPRIERSPAAFTRSVTVGGPLTSDTFTVRNAGGGVLSYTITTSATWLSVTPASGTATGETDTIRIDYHTADLAVGSYAGTITIADPAATNNPQTIAVSLTVDPVYALADYDRDGDVDLRDFAFFQSCFAGPNQPPPYAECAVAEWMSMTTWTCRTSPPFRRVSTGRIGRRRVGRESRGSRFGRRVRRRGPESRFV